MCDYSDAYILVTGNIKVENGNDATRVAIKNCHPFTKAFLKLNDSQVDTAHNLVLTMNLYNMLKYSDNYADTTGSLYQYKRPEPRDNNGNVGNLGIALSSFKYHSGLVQKQLTTPNSENLPANTNPNFANAHRIWKNIKIEFSEFSENLPANTDPNFANAHRIWKNIKIAVPLKYISNFFRNLELPLINTKLHMDINWTKYSVLCNQNPNSIFQIITGIVYSCCDFEHRKQ